jgi:hypothetical protein
MNDGGSAFPNTCTDQGHANNVPQGMTLRDYFAAHHSMPIPGWFRHVPPAKDYEPKPKYWDLPEACRDIAAAWVEDPCYDLVGDNLDSVSQDDLLALRDFVEKWDRHIVGHRAWFCADKAARLAQWAWHYADAMLAARNQQPAEDEIKAELLDEIGGVSAGMAMLIEAIKTARYGSAESLVESIDAKITAAIAKAKGGAA